VGRRPYATKDTSRNNRVLALVTLGEGWHNNHHRYQAAARQGFRWWQIDISFYVLTILSWVGIVHDLRPVPSHVIDETRRPRRGAVRPPARLSALRRPARAHSLGSFRLLWPSWTPPKSPAAVIALSGMPSLRPTFRLSYRPS